MYMNRIKQLRKEKGISQKELAAMLSVGRSTISNFELGTREMSLSTIRKMCVVFGCSADYLLGLSPLKRSELSEDDTFFVAAYQAAPDNIQRVIDIALQPYIEQRGIISFALRATKSKI